jgi:hypothetical protein
MGMEERGVMYFKDYFRPIFLIFPVSVLGKINSLTPMVFPGWDTFTFTAPAPMDYPPSNTP